ncbi:MAG: peptide chain release factor N(5)-glutamine methyltransferase, partial [Actinomycetaceae bacterium]|nr:peptide chain release factor N(5)-glutamine methyltransferase [Actinomycetaceae bacterium]
TPSEELLSEFMQSVQRRCQREPLQHITGTMHFRFLELDATPGTFIVRPETEWLVDEALREAQNLGEGARIVDLCTGSGAIALSLATEAPKSEVWGLELSASAYASALKNNERYGNPVHFIHGDALTALPELEGTVDIVISNPPYIPPNEPITVEAQRDPQIALWGGGETGTEFPRVIIRRANTLLKTGGLLVMEHAESQSVELREYASSCGFTDVYTGRDATGRDRWLIARAGTHNPAGQTRTPPTSNVITIDTKPVQAEAIRRACTCIQRGELIVLPTDTVYGVGADPQSPEAVTCLLAAKGRGPSKPSPVLVSSWDDVERLAVCDERARALAEAFFPGALTLILPAKAGSTASLGETNGTIAVRMPAHDFTLELLAATGSLAVSSANLTDQAPARTIAQARAMLGDKVSLYLDTGSCPENTQASTILSLVAEPRILREGSISTRDIAEIIGEVIPCASTS